MFNLVLTVTTVLFYGGFEEHRTILVANLSEQECIVNSEKMLDRMIDNPVLSGTISCDKVPLPRRRN